MENGQEGIEFSGNVDLRRHDDNIKIGQGAIANPPGQVFQQFDDGHLIFEKGYVFEDQNGPLQGQGVIDKCPQDIFQRRFGLHEYLVFKIAAHIPFLYFPAAGDGPDEVIGFIFFIRIEVNNGKSCIHIADELFFYMLHVGQSSLLSV